MDRKQTQQLRDEISEHADGRSSDEILREIERTRGAMDETLDVLGDRLHPRQLLDDIVDSFRSDGPAGQTFRQSTKQWGRTAVEQLRDNPVPAMLIGAGIAWLAFNSRSKSGYAEYDAYDDESDESYDRRYMRGFNDPVIPDEDFEDPDSGYIPEYSMETVAGSRPTETGETGLNTGMSEGIGRDEEEAHGRLRRAAESARSKARHAGEAVKDTVAKAADRVHRGATKARAAAQSARSKTAQRAGHAGKRIEDIREGAAEMRHRVRERGRDVRHRARERLRENYSMGREQVTEAMDEYPLALGAGALALGLIAGVLMPRTRHEDELLGTRADALKHKVKEVAGEVFEPAKETTITSAAAAANQLEEEGLAPDRIVSKIENVARETKDALKESLRDEELSHQDVKEKLRRVGEEAVHAAKHESSKHREELTTDADCPRDEEPTGLR